MPDERKDIDLKMKMTEIVNVENTGVGEEGVCATIDRLLEAANRSGEHRQINVAIDGMCGGGKSTLGAWLARRYECSLFHMDDFFLRPEQRTSERYAQPGGNVDYERFREEVLAHLADESGLDYRRFDCQTMTIGEPRHMPCRKLNIVEGAYSCHPYFGDIYQARFFVEVSVEEQRKRILERNGAEMLRRFEQEWIPMENRYFEAYGIREKCVIVQY